MEVSKFESFKFSHMKKYKLVVDTHFPKPNPKEQQLKELINGRKPKNAKEKKIVKELEEMKKKGLIPYIPSDL